MWCRGQRETLTNSGLYRTGLRIKSGCSGYDLLLVRDTFFSKNAFLFSHSAQPPNVASKLIAGKTRSTNGFSDVTVKQFVCIVQVA